MIRAASYCILVTPTGDGDEGQKGQIIVVQNAKPERKIFRGVVIHVGKKVDDDIDEGDVAHYTGYHELQKGDGEVFHVVPHQNLVAIED